jgi:Rieske Fe-S protein
MDAHERTRDRRTRWRDDFPVEWERDDFVTRREMAKFLALGSALLAAVSALIAVVGRFWRASFAGPRVRIAKASAITSDGSVLFRYPSADDPCILVRAKDGSLRAYSQVCTHLSCAVVHRPEQDGLFCPCHHGWFDAASGMVAGGPPTWRLPRIRLELEGDDIYAAGKDA